MVSIYWSYENMMKVHRLFLIIPVFLSSSFSLGQMNPTKEDNLDKIVELATQSSLKALRHAVKEVENRSLYPTYAAKDLHWKLTTSDDWTSGFWPGTLWYAYELSKDTEFRLWAIEWTRGIEKQKFNLRTHDLGFRFGCSYGNGLRLAPKDSATRNYGETMLNAAATLDKRFFPLIGLYTSDWDKKPLPNSVPVIIDIMMNLELLFWASQNGGDEHLMDHCLSHAKNTYRDFMRSDGGSFHIVRYDRTTGKVLNKGQLQGDVDSSTWSRGQAWMIYGLTTVYRYTKDPQYLTMAMKVADYFILHLPEDRVAPWDFQSKIDIRDASASVIVTSALFELQGYLTDSVKKNYYLDEAKKMLHSLCLPPYFSKGEGTNCLLLHSTQYYHETDNTDVPSIFADYYFLESIVRYKALQMKQH
jgi:unsaturated chondroitin disaccharide hydrolase